MTNKKEKLQTSHFQVLKDEGSSSKSAFSPPQVHPSVKFFSSDKKLTSF
jgi:hypothetical protein